jgi:hypothetical protein
MGSVNLTPGVLSEGPGGESRIILTCYPFQKNTGRVKFLTQGLGKTKGFQNFGIKQTWALISAVTS